MGLSIRDIIQKEKGLNVSEILYIASYALAEKKEKLIGKFDDPLEPEEVETILRLIAERKSGKPFAYIVGKKEFYSYEFLVNQAVLIPRPETEILVEEAERVLREKKPRRILDMGTGSGVIGITLSIRTGFQVYCVDVSKEALFVAKKNARLHKVEERIVFICSDMFSAIGERIKFDLVVANLPYVDEKDIDSLPKEVKDYEPRIALCGGKRGLELIQRFLGGLTSYLSPLGTVLLEIGGKRQLRSIEPLLLQKGFDVKVIKDYSGRERVIRATWKSL
ncbi:MAG: peptide chain release factor N(5)-glutamine methyltransferase [Deltaproteobacteria bacterium]|nr:peptide chain release factor N(5)-glutamine methyltransferase [Deltaproteobacteria bacterium]